MIIMAHKVRILKSMIARKWLVVEGADPFAGGGRVVCQCDSFKEASALARRRKDIVGNRESVIINKCLYVASKKDE